MKRKLTAILSLCICAFLLVPALALAQEPVSEIQVLTYDNDFFDDVIADFESKNPDIKVIRKLGQGIDTGATVAMLSSDDAPDVLLVNSGPGRVLPLAQAGLLEDLTPYYASRGWDQVVNPSIIETIHNNDEKMWEICNGMDVFSVYYHKEIFDELGLEEPKTFEDFEKICATIRDSGMTPIVVGGRDNYQLGWVMGNFFQSVAGRDFMTGLIYGDGKFTDDIFKQALNKVLAFYDNGYFNSDVVAISGDEAFTSFAMKQSAMIFSGQGNLKTYFADGTLDMEQVSSFAFPSAKGDAAIPTAGMAHSWVVNKNAGNLEGALRFMDYVASLDYQICLGSMDEWQYGIGAIQVEDLSLLNLNPIVSSAFEQLQGGTGYNPSVYLLGNLKSVYYADNQELLMKTKTVDQIAEELQASKEEYLANK